MQETLKKNSDAKNKSYFYQCLDNEGQKQFPQERPKIHLDTISKKKLMAGVGRQLLRIEFYLWQVQLQLQGSVKS